MTDSNARPLWQREFPEFPAADMPAVPAHWQDVSWHNDACPSFEALPEAGVEGRADWDPALRVWINPADPAARECGPDSKRFLCVWEGQGVLSFATDDWQAVLEHVDALGTLDVMAELRAKGFEQWETGGGCIAFVKVLRPDGTPTDVGNDEFPHIVVTAADGMFAPTRSDWLVGRYPDSDWQPDNDGQWPVPFEQGPRDFRAALADALGETPAGAIAAHFSALLWDHFDAEKFAEMRNRNFRLAKAGDKLCCASHDFVDANEVMAEAFEHVAGRAPFVMPSEGGVDELPVYCSDLDTPEANAQNEADTALWNAAWDIAKLHYLTARYDPDRAPEPVRPAEPQKAPMRVETAVAEALRFIPAVPGNEEVRATLQALLAQQGCERLGYVPEEGEGCTGVAWNYSSLCRVCDVVIFG